MLPHRLTILLLWLLLALLAARTVWSTRDTLIHGSAEFYSEPDYPVVVHRGEARFAALRPMLGDRREVGYKGPRPVYNNSADTMWYFLAQYALAPVTVREQPLEHGWTVVGLPDVDRFERFLSDPRYRVIVHAGPRLAIVEREDP